jgi:hypothetical protein
MGRAVATPRAHQHELAGRPLASARLNKVNSKEDEMEFREKKRMRRLQTFLTVSFAMTASAFAMPVSARKIFPPRLPLAGKLLRSLTLAAVGTLVFLCLPLSARAQLYQGVVTNDQTGRSGVLAFDLKMYPNGGPITGYFGDGPPGTNPSAVTRLRGTKSGNHCTVTIEEGGPTFEGICDDQSFSGTFSVGNQTGRFAVYTWSGANCTSPDLTASTSSTNPESNSSPKPTPRPAPERRSQPYPESTQRPTPERRSQPKPEPTSPPTGEPVQQTDIIKYCGTAHNETYNSTIPVEIDLNEANSFDDAVMIVGGAKDKTDLNTFGGGKINGTFAGTNCSGKTDGGVEFHGTCTATTITASYTISGQKGTFTLTKGCP